MNVLGPLYKDKAAQIKKLLEKFEIQNQKKISFDINGETIEIPENCYDIIGKKEKMMGEKTINSRLLTLLQ